MSLTQIHLAWTDPLTGESFDREVPLPATFGRGTDNTLVLTSERVSRKHASLMVDNTAIVLVDSSTNGTFVNGERAPRAAVRPGDVIEVGPFAFTVLDDPAPQSVTLVWAQGGAPQRQAFSLPLTIGRNATNGLVITDGAISRTHAVLEAGANGVTITDQSSNGTFVNGERTAHATVRPGDVLRIGDVTITIEDLGAAVRPAPPGVLVPADSEEMEAPTRLASPPGANDGTRRGGFDAPPATAPGSDATRLGGASTTYTPPGGPVNVPGFDDRTVIPKSGPTPQPAARSFPPAIFDQPIVPIAALSQTGIPIYTCTYAALGGGMGSFIFTDNLIIYGVPKEAIVALGRFPTPYERYMTYTRNSQIPRHERLRSGTESTPDNIWGTPGYAAREAWQDLKKGNFAHALRLMWQVCGEPVFADTYTPRAGDVFESLDHEAKRIGWDRIWRYGLIRAIRKTDDERYVVAFSQSSDQGHQYAFLVANYLELATGYPALRFLPVLQEYRERTGDFTRVINAYEFHDGVYDDLERNGGTVVIQGRGIVASRVIQRIYEARKKNKNIGIIHMMRSPTPEPHHFRGTKRKIIHQVEIQAYNWPKAAWGGVQRQILERAAPEERKQILSDWGGTTAAQRQDWVQIVDKGLAEGWYRIEFAEVLRVDPAPDSKHVTMKIRGRGANAGTTEIVANYAVDATGLEAEVKRNPLLEDLVDKGGAQVNFIGRLAVLNNMEVVGMRNGRGRMYAAGAITLGGPLAGADTFLALHMAAQLIVEDLVRLKAPGLRYLGPLRSLNQWWKWMRGTPI